MNLYLITWLGLAKLVAIRKRKGCLKTDLETANAGTMTVGTFGEDLLVDNDRIAVNENRFFVTHVTSNFGVPALKRKVRARVMIKNGRNPALRIMTIRAGGLPGFCELPRMSIFVATLAIL